ncbi:hypothetical protein ABH935_003489 [Catenulispora sp. GAS73]|uniref:HD domain-containing protein n=1 Tax=Catenulispora sp. GAS73 TaxID=3156269 RepID=UPI0035125F53
MSALAAAVAATAAGIIGLVLADVVTREFRTRLDKLPATVIRVAVVRAPRPLRTELHDEWRAELNEILRGREALPLTRLWIGTRYALGLLRSSRTIGRTLSLTSAVDPLSALLSGASYSDAEQDMLRRAYQVAAEWHQDQWRRSGDPHVTHTVAVARILADLGMDATCVCAGLLHDLPSRTDRPTDRVLAEFGVEVAAIIRDVIALDSVTEPSITALVESTERRVLALKLADRLHNMQTIEFMKVEKQRQKSRETLWLFAPLAGRIGFDRLQNELEDLAVSTLVRTR